MDISTEEALHKVIIDEHGPGSVLRDFEGLLDFIGVDGIKAGGKHHLLPMGRLEELDELMTHPLRPPMKRPQQRSFPHIQGLYLLLRATTLGVGRGSGSKSRLEIDPHMLSIWRDLNLTEQYFNLLEAWLLRGNDEMFGANRSREKGFFTDFIQMHRNLPERRVRFHDNEARERLHLYSHDRLCQFALAELFGLVDVERGKPAKGENWRIASFARTNFGIALFDFLQERFTDIFLDHMASEDDSDFGQLQPLLSEFFPDWHKSLTLPEQEFRDGIYCFRVSLGKIWRRIVVSATADLEDLAQTIIDAYDFDGDHLYCFHLRARDGTRLKIAHPHCDDELFTDEVPVGGAPIEVGEEFVFQYDFGADWRFTVKLERIDPTDPAIDEPRITESHGESPPEYDWDDDEW